jgi:hypothetical protein
MQPLINALSTAAAVRKIPPLKEASPAKVMSCALVTLTDLEKDLDAAKEVTGGVVVSFVKMAGQLPWSAGHGLWPSPPPPPHDERFPLYPRPWNVPSSCSFPPSNDREGAPLGHAYMSHYGDPHSEEGDHPVSTCGPFEQQQR